ncbi:MAG: glycosyltransferase family 39 protein [Thermoanaerobaculia bacterium]
MSPEGEARAAIPPVMWALALLFFVKAAALALFVTPLWDVPDEVVHFSTVSDLESGRGIPRPGRSVIAPDVVARWNRSLAGEPVFNWAAIHPPGYHALAVPFLRAARAATPDLEGQVRGVRLFSALCGALGLLVFFLVMREAGADPPVSLAAAAAVGFVPMYSHMSSGVSHDILCALLGGVAALFWMRLLRTRSLPDAFAVAVALAAAGAVKATAVPLAIALLALLPVHLEGRPRDRLWRGAAVALVALSTTALWSAWRGKISGSDTGPAQGPAREATPLALLEVVRDSPLLDHTFKNFFGLIGWTGTGKGEVAWLQVSGPFLAVYLLLAALLLVLAAAWVWRRDFGGASSRDAVAAASWVLAAALLLASFAWLASGPGGAWPKLLLYSLFLALPCLSILRVWRPRRSPESAVFTSQSVLLVFTLAYLAHIARNALETGVLRGTHGRYFFVVLGFLLSAFALPAGQRLAGWRHRNRALAAGLLLLFANEAAFFAARVLPFYRGAARPPLSP